MGLESELHLSRRVLGVTHVWVLLWTLRNGFSGNDLVLLRELDERHRSRGTCPEASGYLRCVARVRRLYGHGKRREWIRIPPSQRVSRLQLPLLSSCVSRTRGIALFSAVLCPRVTSRFRMFTPSPCEAQYAWPPTPASTASLRREWSFERSPSCCRTTRRSRCPLQG